MAEEQKNSSAETVDAATSAAHTVKGAIKAGKAISGAAKGAAAGGHYGAVAGAVWAGRKHIGKIIAIIAILLLLPVLFLLMLPGLIFGGLVNAFSPADPDTPILNSETAIVENANDITFTINAILGEALDDVIARIEEDFASSGADQMEIKNPYSSGPVYNANLIISQYSASTSGVMSLMPDDIVPTASGKSMKSGYGVKQDVTATLSTDAPTSHITHPQTAFSVFPEFQYETYLRLLQRVSSGRSAKFTFQPNEFSTYNRAVHFSPLWFPDSTDYTVFTQVWDTWTPDGMLSINLNDYVSIDGSLYDDWYTNRE